MVALLVQGRNRRWKKAVYRPSVEFVVLRLCEERCTLLKPCESAARITGGIRAATWLFGLGLSCDHQVDQMLLELYLDNGPSEASRR